jgi:hypothetical protein
LARKTWRFFETFITADDHHLPPDNFQEDPKPIIAHRTSPTNIGLYLLSIVCARDFGWIGTLEMVERLEATLATIGSLERFRGHLYNWYDLHDLRVLDSPWIENRYYFASYTTSDLQQPQEHTNNADSEKYQAQPTARAIGEQQGCDKNAHGRNE